MNKPVAIITASGKGMGAAIARELSAAGYRLALLSNSGGAETLAKELCIVSEPILVEQDEFVKTGLPPLSPLQLRCSLCGNNGIQSRIIMRRATTQRRKTWLPI